MTSIIDQLIRKIESPSYPKTRRPRGRYIVAIALEDDPDAILKAGRSLGIRWHLPSDGLDNPSMFWASTNKAEAVGKLASMSSAVESRTINALHISP